MTSRSKTIPFLQNIEQAITRDNALTVRLARHLRTGTVGVKGRKLQARIVRIEFWGFSDRLGRTRKLTKLTLRVWGWRPRELYGVILRAIDADQRERLKSVRRAKRREAQHIRIPGVTYDD